MSSSESIGASVLKELELLRTRVRELEWGEEERVRELEWREQERVQVNVALDEGMRLAALMRDVSVALIQSGRLQESLGQCAQALVTHLGAAFARIWTLNADTNVLELQASAGMYTHLDGPHARVAVGAFKIGLIASERRPHLTNAVIGDERVGDQEWAAREGMVAFAGYPLLIEGEVVGVMALFARIPLSTAVLDAMASVSNAIAVGIERKRMEEEHAHLLMVEQQARAQAEEAQQRLVRILDNLTEGFMIFDEEWRYAYINPQATPYTGKPWNRLIGKNVWEEFPELVGTIYHERYHYALLHQQPVAFEVFNMTLSEWFDIHAYPVPGGLAVYFRNITARKEAEEERVRLLADAEQARLEAEAALQVRNDFLSSVSHDLKTPLAVIKANAQLLQRHIKRGVVPDLTWLAGRLTPIEASTVKMTGMIEDLLDVAKLQAGQKLDLEMRPLHLVSLVRQICGEQQETTKHHQIEVVVPAEEVVVRGDLVRLDRVLTNLLANAIKYSPKGGQIVVEVVYEEIVGQLWVTLSIQDHGVGIPLADQSHIFEPFYRAGNVATHIQGTGVGLASVAQVLALHDGTITMNSEEGRGSTFLVRLPVLNEEQEDA